MADNFDAVPLGARIMRMLRDTLYRNSLFIIGGQVAAALTSFAFWWLAARWFSANDVGITSGIVAITGLLAFCSKLGLDFGVTRQISKSRDLPGLIILCLIVVVGASIIFAAAFLVGVPVWSPRLVSVLKSDLAAPLIVLVVINFSIAQLFNGILVGKKHPELNVIRATISGIVTIVVLAILARYASGFLPILFAFWAGFGIDSLMLLFFIPRIMSGYPFQFPISVPPLSFFKDSFGNLLSVLAQRATDWVFPLIVLNRIGAANTAYFYIAWGIASGLAAVAAAVSQSLFAEGSNQPEHVALFTQRSLKFGLVMASLITFGGIPVAWFLLRFFGAGYAQEGTVLLQLLLAGVIPNAIIQIYTGLFRVQGRLKLLIGLPGAASLLAIILGTALATSWGLPGIGGGWLLAQILMLGVMGVLFRTSLRQSGTTDIVKQHKMA